MKRDMFEAEMLNKQLEEMDQHLAGLDRRKAEIRGLQEAVKGFTELAEGDEMLVPLAPGLFIRSTYTGDTSLLVNVGKGAVVPRTPEQVVAELQKQIDILDTHQEQMHQEFARKLKDLDALSEKFNEAK